MHWNIHHEESVTSTSDALKARAVAGASEGTIVLADVQSSGRGRRGRVWHSPQGSGLYFSLLLRPKGVAIRDVPQLAPVLGLALVEGLRAETGLDIRIKWPNDILIRGEKLGGVLMESFLEGNAIRFCLAGIGINVRDVMLPDGMPGAPTSLQKLGVDVERRGLLESLLPYIADHYDRYLGSGFACHAPRWNALHAFQDVPVTVDCGGVLCTGNARGVDSEGNLVLDTAEGRRAISVGEVL